MLSANREPPVRWIEVGNSMMAAYFGWELKITRAKNGYHALVARDGEDPIYRAGPLAPTEVASAKRSCRNVVLSFLHKQLAEAVEGSKTAWDAGCACGKVLDEIAKDTPIADQQAALEYFTAFAFCEMDGARR